MVRTSLIFTMLIVASIAYSQGIQVGEVLILSFPDLKEDVDKNTFQSFVTNELIPELNKKNPETSYHLFKADRGDQKGEFLLARAISKIESRKSKKNSDSHDLVSAGNEGLQMMITNPNEYSEYHLIGGAKFGTLPQAGILGLHFIKVREERARDFETFVVNKLHPEVGKLFPDMQMLYYKCVGGKEAGSYLTVFTIDSPSARHKYWPEGEPETEALKNRFKPLESLGKELSTYFVPGSYLEPESGGAAANWESKVWTDYVHTSYLD
jgi:hypothetical protein